MTECPVADNANGTHCMYPHIIHPDPPFERLVRRSACTLASIGLKVDILTTCRVCPG